MATRVEVHDEVPTDRKPGEWNLCFQRCTYHYDGGNTEDGYRFIWRRPDGTLQPARGQARIPDAAHLRRLIDEAQTQCWLT